jgi:ParB family transcriptional regulator, chromosome partitioning protein
MAMDKKRLGRGLSSLLSQPVQVEVPPATDAAKTADTDQGPSLRASDVESTRRSQFVGATVPSQPSPAATAPSSGGAGVPAAAAVADAAAASRRIVQLPVADLVANRHQPRTDFDQAGLESLAASIRRAGVMMPLLVRPRPSAESVGSGPGGTAGPRYELVAGERRWRAAQLAGLRAVPCVIVALSEVEAAEWALMENVQREDLGAMEKAHAFKALVERFGQRAEAVADRVGLDRSTVVNFIRLTELESEIQGLISEKKLSSGHGRALLTIPTLPRIEPDRNPRVRMARRAVAESWSVRKTETMAGELAERMAKGGMGTGLGSGGESEEEALAAERGNRAEKELLARAAELRNQAIEKQLAEHFGTKAKLKMRKRGKAARGSITLEFYGLDQFDGLIAKLGVKLET